MSRELPEWIGKNDDQAVPLRVQVRLKERQPNCAHCGLPINDSFRKPEVDHIVSICNGGPNREGNLQILCKPCHRLKSQVDVAVKASTARRIKKRLGLQKRRTIPGRKFDGTPIPAKWR